MISMMKQSNTIKGRLLRIQEAAAYTGLAVDTLYKKVSQHQVPFVKLGLLGGSSDKA